MSSKEQDLSQIVNIKREDDIYALGTLVCDVSCTVLRNINHSISQMKRERSMQHGYDRADLSRREGRNAVSEHHSGAGHRTDIREVRNHGSGLSEGELLQPLPQSDPVRETDGSIVESGGGSEPVSGADHGEVSEKPQTERSGIDHGDVGDPGAGTADGRGDRSSPDREQISLETEQELNRELNELDSFGSEEREATYHQASLFDFMGTPAVGLPDRAASTFMDELKKFMEP